MEKPTSGYKVKTFNKKSSNCPSKPIECSKIIGDRFFRLTDQLEKNSDAILCMRGDSKKTKDQHEDFIKNLDRLFIVGKKSRSHLNIKIKDEISPTKTLSKEEIITSLKPIVDNINKIIKTYPDNYKISGYIKHDIFSFFEKETIDNLYKWKVFFLFVIHNSGKDKVFNKSSPIVSVTYGKDKFKTASTFSISRNNHNNGLIYVYSLYARSRYYIKTKNLNRKLEEFGVTWHRDTHKEIMLINGIFPHYLLGVFEIKDKIVHNLFINPSLHEILEKDQDFDIEEGLVIDQKNFKELAKQMGYKYFYIQYEGSEDVFLTDTNYDQPQKLIEV